jgi:hypothetical protein
MDDKNNSQDPQLGSILNLLRDIPMLNSPPADTPRTPISFALYDSGGVRRFYIFFNGVWRYVTLT